MATLRHGLRAPLVLPLLALTASLAMPAEAVVPDQYIAKLYTEGLGRIPDQGGWAGRVSYFQSNGCTLAGVRAHGSDVYNSVEFSNRGYDNESKLLALFRGLLNREPDAATFNTYLSQLNSGTPWSTVVNSVLNSSEFNLLSSTICSPTLTGYNWGSQAVLNLTPGAPGFQGGTGAQLQAVLNGTPPGGTVYLAQKSVTRLTTTLVIPPGVTLATWGLTNRNRYAAMGRLVRDSAFNAEMVKLQSGSKLRYVWTDGRRNIPSAFVSDAINVRMHGGSNVVVEGCRMDNSRGWSTLQSVGWSYTCGSHAIRNNLVTTYSSSHSNVQWTDGLSVACENALVENNEVIDATDVPIVLFRSDAAVQRSIVRNNLLLNAGNSAYGGLVVDPLNSTGGTGSYDFTGASVTGNTLWTGSRVHYDIGISVGTKAWFGATADAGVGVSVTNNTTGSQQARVDIGIAVAKMFNVFVQSNTLSAPLVNPDSNCPNVNVLAAISAGEASGSIQPYTDTAMPHCIGH